MRRGEQPGADPGTLTLKGGVKEEDTVKETEKGRRREEETTRAMPGSRGSAVPVT